uniref:Uncharacterized protein n=1 Tax=Archaeoglobus fulgidus TaxID=2234 RepID=A0A7J2TGI2_ARCFL
MNMETELKRLLEEKDKKIEELQAKIKDLERKLKYYEIREVYQGIIPDEVIQKLVELPPEVMVLEIGKYLRGVSTLKLEKAEEKEKPAEKMAEKVEITGERGLKAKVGVDLSFTQRYDFTGSDVAMLGEDLMNALKVSEGDYIVVQKNGSVNLRVIPYSKSGFIVLPSWVREKIGAKLNDFVEVMKK